MQKRVGIIFISLLLVLSVGFVSAGWFGDLWGKITGHAVVNGMNCPDSLIAYFPFDVDAASNVNSIYNPGVGQGISFVDGKIGKAANFGPNSPYVQLTPINLGKTHTVSFWINLPSGAVTGNSGTSIFKHGTDNNYYFFIRNLPPWNFGFFAGGNSFSAYPNIPTSSGFTSGTWEYLTLVRDGTNMTVYVNGNYAANWVGSNGANNDFTIDRIGADNFAGKLDEVAMFNRALSASEVQTLYNNEAAGTPVCTKIQPTCTPNWQCGDWSACTNGQQTRNCNDTNGCGINSGMPTTGQSCTMPVTNVTGCCINNAEGTYEKNVPQSMCTGTNVTFDSSHPLCDLPGATLGCCVFAGRTIFNTHQACVKFSAISGGNSSVDWRQINEAQCLALNQTSTTCSNLDSFVNSGIAQKMDSYYTLKNFQLDDDVFDIDLVYLNSEGNVIGIGKDGENMLRTSSGSLTFDTYTDRYFVASDTITNKSYLMRATNFKIEFGTLNRTTIQYRNNGSWHNVKQDAVAGDGVYIGNVGITLEAIDYHNRQVTLVPDASTSFSKLYSKEGIVINLPLVDSSGKISCPSFSMPSIAYSGNCTDSDGGENIYVRGYTNDSKNGILNDSCDSSQVVAEAVCDSNLGGVYVHDPCPTGTICNNGACVSSTNNTTCTPSMICNVGPIVCPADGKQTKTCYDSNNCGAVTNTTEVIECNPGVCSGCELNSKCLSYGFRLENNGLNSYCDVDGQIKEQKVAGGGNWAKCQNNYECASNLCSGGECVEINSMIKEVTGYKAMGIKILCKLADMFGVQGYDECIVGYLGNQTASS